jgi:hypothetical protein
VQVDVEPYGVSTLGYASAARGRRRQEAGSMHSSQVLIFRIGVILVSRRSGDALDMLFERGEPRMSLAACFSTCSSQ